MIPTEIMKMVIIIRKSFHYHNEGQDYNNDGNDANNSKDHDYDDGNGAVVNYDCNDRS